MLLSAVSVLVVAQSSSEIPEGLMKNPVYIYIYIYIYIMRTQHVIVRKSLLYVTGKEDKMGRKRCKKHRDFIRKTCSDEVTCNT